jgi:hypothetical protein
MKKVFALFLVVLSIVSFAGSAKQADASIYPCPPGYAAGNYSATYYIAGGDGTAAAKVIINPEYCYNGTDLQVNLRGSAISLHRLWTNPDLDIITATCSYGPDCMRFHYNVKFSRTYADGSPRSSICATYGLLLNANGYAESYFINPKSEC